MRKLSQLTFILALGALCSSADNVLGPALQWVQAFGGSGASQVTAAATDAQGNFYIVGNTSSVDFPVTSAIQGNAGGSTLIRIDTATGRAQKLYPSGLLNATSIAVDPRNAQTVYATQANAVWRSTDGGATWASLTPFSSTVARSVEVDPLDSNTLYAATSPQGLFKSTDAGVTWTAINSGIPVARDGSINATRVWADPKIPQVLFVGAGIGLGFGLLRSGNGGDSWEVVPSANNIAPTLTFDPFSAGTLYLIIYFPSRYAICKSTDDGKSFAELSTLPDQAAPNALIADPFHQGALYAGSFSGIHRSTDGGASWTKKASGLTRVLAADPNNPVLYADLSNSGIVRSADGFDTLARVGPPASQLGQIVVGGPALFAVAAPTTDAFVVKLDSNGAVVYSTYFGGSASDSATALALGSDGSVYVTGSTVSLDFPVTPGAYNVTALTSGSNFVFKLNPDGSLTWSTFFADTNTKVASIAVDASGNPYIAGSSNGQLPTTAGAYQTDFHQTFFCTGFIGCLPGPSSAFVTKMKADGTGLIYSTYVPVDSRKATISSGQSLLLDSTGNAYFGGGFNVVLLNADGSALLGSTSQGGGNISAIARDAAGNIYATGSTSAYSSGSGNIFPATPGAFQPAPQPAIPNLPAQQGAGGQSDAFVMKWDSSLSTLLAATLLGGELVDLGESIAVDSSGNVIVSGASDSRAFPTRAFFQTTFSSRAGFVAGLDSTLSHLLFSTYLGDGRPFEARVVVPDGNGNILLAGATLSPSSLFIGGDPGLSYTVGSLVVANKIALPPAPAARLDSIVNFASRFGGPVAPGEAILATGSGFGSDAQLLIDGASVPVVSITATSLVAMMPEDANTSGGHQIQVSTGGSISNRVLVPAAPAVPGLFSVDGSGYGQGFILNSDGTMNSPDNPAASGSAITIFATGVGKVSFVAPYAVTALPPSVFIDGFYADGIAATFGPVTGIPGNVYQLGIYVPDPATRAAANPNLLNFKMPPRVGVKLIFGAVNTSNSDNSDIISQPGLVLNVKQ